MTIFTTAAALLATGPQTLADLVAHVVGAGATRSLTPEAAVRSALIYRAVELPDGRWASPVQLLDGRVLTTRGVHPDVDLAPLHAVDRWLGREVTPFWFEEGPLHAVRLLDEVVNVERVEVRPTRELAVLLGPLTPSKRWQSGFLSLAETMTARLWEHLDADPALLTVPGLPLSECFPELEKALREQAQDRARREAVWCPSLELPAWMHGLADCLASEAGLNVHDYLVEVLTEALTEDRQPAKLIALPRR